MSPNSSHPSTGPGCSPCPFPTGRTIVCGSMLWAGTNGKSFSSCIGSEMRFSVVATLPRGSGGRDKQQGVGISQFDIAMRNLPRKVSEIQRKQAPLFLQGHCGKLCKLLSEIMFKQLCLPTQTPQNQKCGISSSYKERVPCVSFSGVWDVVGSTEAKVFK